jgi:hypothetical protein
MDLYLTHSPDATLLPWKNPAVGYKEIVKETKGNNPPTNFIFCLHATLFNRFLVLALTLLCFQHNVRFRDRLRVVVCNRDRPHCGCRAGPRGKREYPDRGWSPSSTTSGQRHECRRRMPHAEQQRNLKEVERLHWGHICARGGQEVMI